MKITVEKYTDIDALHTANSFTTGHESKMSLHKAYSLMHTPIRTQRFYVYMEDIPLFCASQFVRSTQGVQWYQRTKRPDRGGGADFNDVCRNIAFGIRTEHVTHEDEPLSSRIVKYGEWADAVEELPYRFDRYAPTSLMGDMNAEAIIHMSHKRLCAKASPETREVWQEVVNKIREIDPDLAKHCVPQCMYRGGICPEPKGCGYNKTELFNKALTEYKKLFT